MRPWILVGLAACSPGGKDVPPAQHHEEARHSIDVTVHGAPVSIRGLEIARGAKHSVELGYRLESKDRALRVPAEITCRVHGFNLVYPASDAGKVAGPRLTGLWRPDPFDEDGEPCQIDFLRDGGVIASACVHGLEVSDGACASWPSPDSALLASHEVDLAHAVLEFREDAAVVTGVYTLLAALPAGERVAAQLSCEDSAGPIVGETALPFIPLERMRVGSSAFGPVAILLDRKPRPLAACDFRILTRPASAGGTRETIHAQYCLTTAAVRVGRCAPN